MPIDELSRILFGSLVIMSSISFIITKYDLIEKIRKWKITNFMFTVLNICLSLIALYVVDMEFFIGLLFVYLSVGMWFVQYSETHSPWIRSITMINIIFIMSILFLWWFDSLPLWKKMWIVFKNS